MMCNSILLCNTDVIIGHRDKIKITSRHGEEGIATDVIIAPPGQAIHHLTQAAPQSIVQLTWNNTPSLLLK